LDQFKTDKMRKVIDELKRRKILMMVNKNLIVWVHPSLLFMDEPYKWTIWKYPWEILKHKKGRVSFHSSLFLWTPPLSDSANDPNINYSNIDCIWMIKPTFFQTFASFFYSETVVAEHPEILKRIYRTFFMLGKF
jgi:hypothetical protein